MGAGKTRRMSTMSFEKVSGGCGCECRRCPKLRMVARDGAMLGTVPTV